MRALSEIAVRGLGALHVLMRLGRAVAPAELAKAAQAPQEALDALLPRLLAAGLITHGRLGYALAKAPGEIRLQDVLEALEEPEEPEAPCGGNFETCPSRAACVLAVLCRKADENFRDFLRGFTLEDLRDAKPDLPNCMNPEIRRKKRGRAAEVRRRRRA
jgi:Rrf2 family protein